MKIIGHRGAAGLAPENTLASFKKALEIGVDGVELDVHLTSDGILAVSHEPFHLLESERAFIRHHTYAQLKKIKSDTTNLEAVIELVNRRVPIVIEVKDHTATQASITCVRSYLDKGWQITDFAFCSFQQAPLLELREAFPSAELIVNERWSSVKACWRARQVGSKRLSMNQNWLWRGYLRAMSRRGWLMSAYTVNSTARAEKWRPYLYSLYTDRPDLIQN